MKKILLTSILAVLVTVGTTAMAQDYPDEYLGLPGDNLNLYAVMKLFQESETLETFERNLNDENNRINNLDLNNDNYVDYITVNDYVDGEVHTIVLRVALDRNESQDIAVFTVQKFRDGSVQIQLIGDEALYGKNYIIEPYYAETPNPGYTGRSRRNVNVRVIYTSYYEVAGWPLVRFIYLPHYHLWHSSWYWDYYPPYWHPWRPFFWHYYYGYHYNWYHHYYTHYRFWHQPRYPRYHEFYFAGYRSHSPKVYDQINKGGYKSTYSHPEQRRDGEVLFSSMHPSQEKRTEQNTPVISQRRSPSAQMTRTTSSTRTTTSTSRRTDEAALVRAGESHRPATLVNERPVSKSSSNDDQSTRRRTVPAKSEKEVSRPKSSENATIYRREPEPAREREVSRPDPVKERVVSRPEPSERVVEVSRETARPERREEAPRISHPSRSQSERKAPVESKSDKTERRTEKSQRPEESKGPRR